MVDVDVSGVDCDPYDPPDDATVILRDVHVDYHVGGRHRPSLLDVFARGRDGGDPRVRSGRVIHAVQGISLVARRGESIGFIGRNGSGKSTTLKALSGLLPASRGEVYASSQPVLLGVGAAMVNSLSGRRNVELGCLALGMDRDEVAQRVDEIAEFADLGEFIDLPMRTYSSGMRARLLFSIATSIQPEILLVDEALAVGDQAFRRKSRRRIRGLLNEAGTVFMVSHSLGRMKNDCSRIVWIDKGRVMMDGDPDEVIGAYRRADGDVDALDLDDEDEDD